MLPSIKKSTLKVQLVNGKRVVLTEQLTKKERSDTTQPEAHAGPLLAAQKIGVVYGRKSFLASLLGRAQDRFTGNREVSLTIRPGEILAGKQ